MNLGTVILLALVLAGVVMLLWLWSRTWGRPSSDGMEAPKFGSAGSGGAEHEPVGRGAGTTRRR